MSGHQHDNAWIADPRGKVVCPGCKSTFASHQYLEKHLKAEQPCHVVFYRRNPSIEKRIAEVRRDRLATGDKSVNKLASRSHQFREFKGGEKRKIFVPIVSSEAREYFPAGVASDEVVPTNKAFYAPNGALWALSAIVSKLHLVWIGTICGRLEMRYSYSNTLGWNTFPLPTLTEVNK